eukprot:Gregarina_sp_Poly_1__3151@NODE_1892_length_3130_cov_184_804440_g1226_i0_p4_GENE_NODE_1892_length_3130_cov_184_804440_g1226_i0NODE_1892_length_3130_cov_184_804440_g1226_i0_p4_ORF_typecomplete_len122_score14_82C2/PF00168_30/6_4e16_NODE_1892_length_3130_cov_184_804440_g1226_i09031268
MTFLRVTIVGARNMPKRSGPLDKLDPYVICQVGDQSQKTSVKKNAGSSADYNEVMDLPYNAEPVLFLYVKDYDKVGKDDLVGSGKLELTTNVLGHGFRGGIPLFNAKGISAGEVTVEVTRH